MTTRLRSLLAPAALVAAVALLPMGCGDDPDMTGDSKAGIGAAGTNDPNAPQSPEEAYKRQMEEEAAFQKKGRRS